jgi:beta-N-acetylhexosaminidase
LNLQARASWKKFGNSMMSKLGPVVADLKGLKVSSLEHDLLKHPQLGGIILFSRNFANRQQLHSLCKEIRDVSGRNLLIAVDQEGGRVQRFKDEFTTIPPAASYADNYLTQPEQCLALAYDFGKTMAEELRAEGVDLSFAPVLDINSGVSDVIGDRAFHGDSELLKAFAKSWINGMHSAGMAAVGKHFPGHGHVSADSHIEVPVDQRSFDELLTSDLDPFVNLLPEFCEGVMTAHVAFPEIDNELPTYSEFWLKEILRDRIGFSGVVFSDDLSMGGALGAGRPSVRANMAFKAGCDAVLICNDSKAAWQVLNEADCSIGLASRVSLTYVQKSQYQ